MEEELVATLKGTLEPDVAVIKAAQNHLQENLHLNPSAGIALINVVSAGPTLPLAIRQAAAVNLSLWIKERWGPFFSEFVGFPSRDGVSAALPIEYKGVVREALLTSCRLEEGKLRGPMIKALVNVASCDWPDEFPTLLPTIQRHLTTQDGSSQGFIAIQGALSFLDDWFYTSMDETSLMSITREILPIIEVMVAQQETYSIAIRCRCISIFNQMLETLWMVKEQYPEASKAVSAEIMPRWLDLLTAIVGNVSSIPAGNFSRNAGEQLGLQSQAWNTISTATHFPAHIKSRLSGLISTAMDRLTSLQDAFERYHLEVTSAEAIEGEEESDFFASPASLAAKVIDFVGIALQNSISKSTTSASILTSLVPLLQSYSRITAEEQEEWLENVSAFVAAGDEDGMGALNASMRARCADILSEMVLMKERETISAVKEVISKAHRSGKERKERGVQDWWKEEEAVLALLGGIAEHLIERIEDAKELGQPSPFKIDYVFATIVFPNMHPSVPYFLYGRCFVFASHFSAFLPRDMSTKFLAAAVEAVESLSYDHEEGGAIVKISAVRCLKNLYRHLPAELVRPYSSRVLSQLGPILSTASEDTLVLIVETLQSIAMQDVSGNVEMDIPGEAFGEIVTESIKAWAREASDRVLQSAVEDLLEALAGHSNANAASMVVRKGLSLCAELLNQEKIPRQDKYRSNVAAEAALEFAGAIARGADDVALVQSGAVPPFLSILYDTANQSDDREVYRNSATLLSSLIAKIPTEILSWNDNRGIGSVQHILTLISKMISPEDTSESGGLAVGDLLTTILRKAPESVASNLPQLCTALATRLATSESTLLAQSLILPLAYLIKDHLETVVGLLSSQTISIEGGQKTLLQVLMKNWCDFAPNFQGFWNTRVSALGLCAMLRQSSLAGLNDVIVDGDLIPEDTNIIKTRSRAKLMPDRYTQIPVPAKILKLIINEYTQSVDGRPSQSKGSGVDADGDQGADGDDNDDDEWDDDEDFAKKQRQDAFLSDLLGEDLDGGLDSLFAQQDEEQYEDDPIYNMQFRTFLTGYLRELAQNGEAVNGLGPFLTPREVQILQNAIA